MIVRLEKANGTAHGKTRSEKEAEPEADALEKISEAEKIVSETKQQIAEGTTPAVGISGSNSGRGYDVLLADGKELVVTMLEEAVEEEPEPDDDDDDDDECPEVVSAKAKEPTGTAEAPAKPRAPKN